MRFSRNIYAGAGDAAVCWAAWLTVLVAGTQTGHCFPLLLPLHQHAYLHLLVLQPHHHLAVISSCGHIQACVARSSQHKNPSSTPALRSNARPQLQSDCSSTELLTEPPALRQHSINLTGSDCSTSACSHLPLGEKVMTLTAPLWPPVR